MFDALNCVVKTEVCSDVVQYQLLGFSALRTEYICQRAHDLCENGWMLNHAWTSRPVSSQKVKPSRTKDWNPRHDEMKTMIGREALALEVSA